MAKDYLGRQSIPQRCHLRISGNRYLENDKAVRDIRVLRLTLPSMQWYTTCKLTPRCPQNLVVGQSDLPMHMRRRFWNARAFGSSETKYENLLRISVLLQVVFQSWIEHSILLIYHGLLQTIFYQSLHGLCVCVCVILFYRFYSFGQKIT